MNKCFVGIDAGSLHTPAYVAWLNGQEFTLDMYQPTEDTPLPRTPAGLPAPAVFAVDAPQGLPCPGARVREADRKAGTPTNKLPSTRAELEQWKLYGGLIRVGVMMFWAAQVRGLAKLYGLENTGGRPLAVGPETPVLAETYPRYVLHRLWPNLHPPSKRKAPLAYVDAVWRRLRATGYACRSVVQPTVDQVDAMLCALAAKACEGGRAAVEVGCPPMIDEGERLFREGWIVSPAAPTAAGGAWLALDPGL